VKPVDWTAYAREYDLMARHNPAYQELVAHCVRTVAEWSLQPGDTVADFGAGTGNFSIQLAQARPEIQVLHLDADEQMLRSATAKADAAGLKNWRALNIDLAKSPWQLPELAGIVCVHCIYAVAQPRQFIRQLCVQLRPGGYVYACDFARQMNVRDWARYLVLESLRTNGAWRTARLFTKCGQMRRQNRRVAAAQRAGKFWVHNLVEFADCFRQEGMTILETSDRLYRGYDTLVIAQRPVAPVTDGAGC